MRKLVMLLALGFMVMPCFSQGTALVLDASVRRIPVNAHTLVACTRQKVLLYFEKGMMGVRTDSDTLQLRRVGMLPPSYPNSASVLTRDDLHANQIYTVTIIESPRGLAFFITPVVDPARPSPFDLYSIIISSQPCGL